jgi:hypothetical protein
VPLYFDIHQPSAVIPPGQQQKQKCNNKCTEPGQQEQGQGTQVPPKAKNISYTVALHVTTSAALAQYAKPCRTYCWTSEAWSIAIGQSSLTISSEHVPQAQPRCFLACASDPFPLAAGAAADSQSQELCCAGFCSVPEVVSLPADIATARQNPQESGKRVARHLEFKASACPHASSG